ALRVDLEDASFVAGADEQRAVGLRDHRPQKRRRRLVDELGRRAERQLAAAVDRQVFDVAFEEIVLRRGLEELGRRGVARQRQQEGGGRRQQTPGGTLPLSHVGGRTPSGGH